MLSTILSTSGSKGARLAIHVCCLASHTAILSHPNVLKVDSLCLHLECISSLFGSLDPDGKLFHLCIHGDEEGVPINL